jgi:hypothetical protein
MGFQVADLRPFCRELLEFQGVAGVWLLSGPTDHDALLYVTVAGFGGPEFDASRMAVYRAVENFLAERRADMSQSAFIFDYFVLADADPELGEPGIPAGAERIAA